MPLPDIALTKDDFDRCRWQDVIARCSNKECLYYYQLFFTEAKDCKQRGDARAEAVFALLAAATSLMPKLDSKDEPFGPMAVMNNFRSAILDDFNDTHLHIFEELVPHVVDPEMRARITDILWIKRRDHRMARHAVESYLESAKVLEDPEHWPPCADRINRAVQLAAVLGRNQEPFSSTMAHVEAVLENTRGRIPCSYPRG